MKPIRYFRDGECFWKFEEGHHPQRKNGAASEWEDSYFSGLGEFLRDPGGVQEIGRDEAEGDTPY